MRIRYVLGAALLPAILSVTTVAAAEPPTDKRSVERGHYLVSIAGCNDCHTPRYMEVEGKVPEKDWLVGVPVGFQGPWGTTYPVNLRLYVQGMSEAQWIARVRQPMRPPMPWFALRDMSDADLRATYRYIRSLGAAGEPAPAYVPPGQVVNTPYIEFVPKNLPKQAHASH